MRESGSRNPKKSRGGHLMGRPARGAGARRPGRARVAARWACTVGTTRRVHPARSGGPPSGRGLGASAPGAAAARPRQAQLTIISNYVSSSAPTLRRLNSRPICLFSALARDTGTLAGPLAARQNSSSFFAGSVASSIFLASSTLMVGSCLCVRCTVRSTPPSIRSAAHIAAGSPSAWS